MAESTRTDIQQTSTGVGHHYRPGYYFPSSNFKSVIGQPLPPELTLKDEITSPDVYQTTSGKNFDEKHLGGIYGNRDPYYKKAPGHWKVDYVKNHHEKLGSGGHRRPLSMGNQTSEAHEQYRNQPALKVHGDFMPNPQGFVLSNHHTDGPSKKIVPSTTNDKLKGRSPFVPQKGILTLNDPYLTTTNQYHHAFLPKDLKGYAKKDVPTYWECEEYAKAWGHGLKHNPLPKDTVPRERPPMRDTMVFKTETKIRRIPDKSVPVPHGGLKPLYTESYQEPSDPKMARMYYTPVDTPFTLPAPGPKSAYSAPGMYNTEYKQIGSENPITV